MNHKERIKQQVKGIKHTFMMQKIRLLNMVPFESEEDYERAVKKVKAEYET